MKPKLYHPIWTHFPAIAILIVNVVLVILASPFPAQSPVHFNSTGEPDAYGSPWGAIATFWGLSILFLALSIFFDELWARQENKKTFNWLSLFDEIPIGLFCAIGISYVNTLGINNSTFVFPWELTLIIVGSGVVWAVVIEFLRPFKMHPSIAFPENDKNIEAQIRADLKSNKHFVYWDAQNPFWVQLLSIIMPLTFITISIIQWFSIIWMSILYLIIGLTSTIFYGGLRTMITQDIVLLKVGFLGIRLLKLKSSDIIQAETVKFSPLHDFGGYGFRINSEMKAYFFKGNMGTKITTRSGKKYLIGSDNAQRLTVIINSMKNT